MFSQSYEYGVVPPITLTVTSPSVAILQDGCDTTEVVNTNGLGW